MRLLHNYYIIVIWLLLSFLGLNILKHARTRIVTKRSRKRINRTFDTVLSSPHKTVYSIIINALITNLSFRKCYAEGEMMGKEIFMKSTIYIRDKLSAMKWDISDETKSVGKRECQGATVKSSPDISVRFSKNMPTNREQNIFKDCLDLYLKLMIFLAQHTSRK